MNSKGDLKKELALLEGKDYPVQKVAIEDNQVTEKIVEESVEELNPDEATKERG